MTTITIYPVMTTSARANLPKPVATETTDRVLTVEQMSEHLGKLVADQTFAVSGRREMQFWNARKDGTGFLTVVNTVA